MDKQRVSCEKNEDVDQQDVKIYCTKNQFPGFPFCGPHNKPHGVRGLPKNYHMRFDPKLVHGTCAICCIPCACIQYKYKI